MRPIVERLDEIVAGALARTTGVPAAPAAVRGAQDERFGDFQANGVMGVAKKVGRKGPELAREVLARCNLEGIAGSASVAGPGFINIALAPSFIEETLSALAQDDRLGVDAAAAPETIVVDFSCPNVAKEMHVGHIRSTIIGDAVSRLLEFQGQDVRRINHLGDWGTQFGMLIQYLRRNHPRVIAGEERLEISDLEDFYRRAKELFDADPAFKEAARREVVKLQGGDPESLAAWSSICEESRRKFQENYDALDIAIEAMGESFYNAFLPEVVEDLLARGIARESEGAVCAFVDAASAPFMVRKSDGGYGYAATDLAALRYRVQVLGARRIIYVTDARQREHFRHLFAVARRAGYAGEGVRLEHAAFGSILGKDGTPLKTREGKNVRLAEVIAEAIQRAEAVVAAKSPELDAAERDRISRIVGIGALKYADLSQNPASDYVFDWDTMLSLDGDTAPYLQYAYARVRSIFRKGGVEPEAVRGAAPAVREPAERRLAVWLLRFNEAVESAAADCRPNAVANYLYELAARFTGFYNDCPVLRAPEPDRTSRLLVCDVTARAMARGLGLLGIKVSERM